MLIQNNIQAKSKEDLNISSKKEATKAASKLNLFLSEKKNKDLLTSLKNEIYYNKNYPKAQEILENFWDLLRKPEYKNKHKCNRQNDCECIVLGFLLIDNLFFANAQNEAFNLMKNLENYFMNPDINMPFKLFVKVIRLYLGLLKYNEARSFIENYITYSAIPNSSLVVNTSKRSFIRKSYELNAEEYTVLNKMLVFDIILITTGFSKAKSKIMSLELDEVKKSFLEKLIEMYNQCMPQTGNGAKFIDPKNLSSKDGEKADEFYFYGSDSKPKNISPEIEGISEKIVRSGKSTRISFGSFVKFIINNSIGQKLYNMILRKKFISALFLLSGIYLLYKFYIRYIYQYGLFTSFYSKIMQITVIRRVIELFTNFIKNLFNLLLNN